MLNGLITTLKSAMKGLQRDPDITAASVDDGELADELRKEAFLRKEAEKAA